MKLDKDLQAGRDSIIQDKHKSKPAIVKKNAGDLSLFDKKNKTVFKDANNDGNKEEYLFEKYYDNGKLSAKKYYKDLNDDKNKEEYTDENYDIKGKLVFKESYKDANSDGNREEYLFLENGTDGKLTLKNVAKDANSDGNNEKYLFEEYDDNNKVSCREFYQDDNSDGNKEKYFCKVYGDDGKLAKMVNSKDPDSDGVAEEYSLETPNSTEKYRRNRDKTFSYYSLKEKCNDGITIDSKIKGKDIYNVVNIPSFSEKTEIKINNKSGNKLFNLSLDRNKTGEIQDNDNGLIFRSSIQPNGVTNPFGKKSESKLEVLTVERFGQTTVYETSKTGVKTKDKQGNVLGETNISGSTIDYKINDSFGSVDLDKLVPQKDPHREKILELLKSQPASILNIIEKIGLQSIYSSNSYSEVPNAKYENKKIIIEDSFDEYALLHELGHALDDFLADKNKGEKYASRDKNSEVYEVINMEKKNTPIVKQKFNDYIYNPASTIENRELFAGAFALSHGRFLTQEGCTIEIYSAMDDLKDLGDKLNKIIDEKIKTQTKK